MHLSLCDHVMNIYYINGNYINVYYINIYCINIYIYIYIKLHVYIYIIIVYTQPRLSVTRTSGFLITTTSMACQWLSAVIPMDEASS